MVGDLVGQTLPQRIEAIDVLDQKRGLPGVSLVPGEEGGGQLRQPVTSLAGRRVVVDLLVAEQDGAIEDLNAGDALLQSWEGPVGRTSA
jgi:hypothetical protein